MTTDSPGPAWQGKAAWIVVAVLFIGILADVARHPAAHTTMPTYRLAATQWWQGNDPYSTREHDGFYYFPQAAVVFAPFNLLPGFGGDLAWRACGFGLFLYALARLNRIFFADDGKTFLILCLLAVPSSMASLRNAQFDLPLAALIVLTTMEVAEARWTPAAVWICLAIALKPLAVVPLLLFWALYWKLIPRVLIGLLVVIALPFLHWSPAFVAHEYGRCIESLVQAAKANEPRYSDLGALVSQLGYNAPDEAKTVVRILFALIYFGLGAMAVRRLSRVEAAWVVGALSADYLMLFNPRTETCSYVFLGPFVASAAVWCLGQPTRRRLGCFLVFAAIGLACDAFPKIGAFSIHDMTDRWFKPLMAVLFLLVLLRFVFGKVKIIKSSDQGRPRELSEAEFKATFDEKMNAVTSTSNPLVDIWPYAREIRTPFVLPPGVIEQELVEYVYRTQSERYDHVLIPTGKKNIFVVIVVDRKQKSIFGHRLLDLYAAYGLPT